MTAPKIKGWTFRIEDGVRIAEGPNRVVSANEHALVARTGSWSFGVPREVAAWLLSSEPVEVAELLN